MARLLRILPALIVSIAVVLSAALLGRAFVRSHYEDSTIRVTGSARRVVRSDYIVWTAEVTYQAPTLSAAYTSLESGESKLNHYLLSNGLASDEIFPQAIQTTVLYTKSAGDNGADDSTVYRTIQGYRLTQDVEARSSKVETVQDVSRTVTELIIQGVSLQSEAPEYRIVKLADLKDSILAEAAENAFSRADQIAKSSRVTLGTLRFCHMGEMTVTGAYADESPDDGSEDTASLDKKVTVEVTSAYDIR